MKMKKLSEDHYIIMDDSEIKKGDWYYLPRTNSVYQCKEDPTELNLERRWGVAKITHSTQPLDKSLFFTDRVWGCERLSLGEVKELIGEVEVEQYAWDNPVLSRKDVYELFNDVFKDRMIEGAYRISASKQVYRFNNKLRELAKQKALEDNMDKKYTEEDMQWALHEARHHQEHSIEEIIQSLQPKTEWEVEFVDGKLKFKP